MQTSTLMSLFVKVVFLIAIPMQTMLWPTVSSICFVCIYGLVNIMLYFRLEPGGFWNSIAAPGVFVYAPEKKPANYIFTVIMLCYFVIYFFEFITQETKLLPTSTLWLDPSFAANYSTQTLPVDVTSDISKNMRANPFEWSRSVQLQAIQVLGTIQAAAPIQCGNTGNFRSYVKGWSVQSPITGQQALVPLSSQFYDVDFSITPSAGSHCADRLSADVNLNVIQPLDYQASTIPNWQNRLPVFTPPCKLFNGSSSFCLQVSHTFTPQQYAQEQVAQCSTFNQQLIFRLPPRGTDIDQESGRMMLDILLVSSSAASVNLHAAWKKTTDSGSS